MSSQFHGAPTPKPPDSAADVRIGFVPLADCATLAIAHEKGFFARHGLKVELRKVQSWAQIHDRLLAGEFDLAHMLITMPLLRALESESRISSFCYAFTLSRHGNGILISNALWKDGVHDPAGLKTWLDSDVRRTLRLGIVYPRSTHEYFLKSWLDTGGLRVGPRIVLRIIPPQEMVGRLRKGEIDGFCVGEPWSRRAADSKLGRIVAESGSFLNGMGEKVLGTTLAWHQAHQHEHALLLRALSQASVWLEDPANHVEALDLLASKKYVNTARSAIESTLKDESSSVTGPGNPKHIQFFRDGTNFPSRKHAEWYLDQIVRWEQAAPEAAARVHLESLCLEEFHRVSLREWDPGGALRPDSGKGGSSPGEGISCHENPRMP